MTTRLSSKRQVVLPAAVCKRLGLAAGDALDVQESSGRISLVPRKQKSPERARILIEPRTGIPYLKAPKGTPPVTSEMVRALLADFP